MLGLVKKSIIYFSSRCAAQDDVVRASSVVNQEGKKWSRTCKQCLYCEGRGTSVLDHLLQKFSVALQPHYASILVTSDKLTFAVFFIFIVCLSLIIIW